MNRHYDIIVTGAGLAGCSSAIQLAEQGYRVLLLEQQRYPVHKLCGEFLSVEVIAAFERLGILEAVRQAGAHSIRRTYLTTSTGASFESELPGVALGLSRYQLDLILFQRSQELGARCLDGTVVRSMALLNNDMNLPPNPPFWGTLGLSKSLTCGGFRGRSRNVATHHSYLDSATPDRFRAICSRGLLSIQARETLRVAWCWGWGVMGSVQHLI